MKVFDGFPAKMPNIFRQTDGLSPDDAIVERLLSGHDAGPGAPRGQQAVALVLEAAARPASERELSGECQAVAAFLAAIGTHGPSARDRISSRIPVRPRRGTAHWLHTRPRRGPRPHSLTRRLVLLAVACLVAATIALWGTAAAGGGLPAPLQQVAHTVFGAPAPRPPTRRPSTRRPTVPASPSRPAPGGHSHGRAIFASHAGRSHKTSTGSLGTEKVKGHKKTERGKKASKARGKHTGKAKTKSHHKKNGNGNGPKKRHAKGGTAPKR
jgi:hypothetical protein